MTSWYGIYYELPLDMKSIMNYKFHAFHSLYVESDLKLPYVDTLKTVKEITSNFIDTQT